LEQKRTRGELVECEPYAAILSVEACARMAGRIEGVAATGRALYKKTKLRLCETCDYRRRNGWLADDENVLGG
jgi:hypothetical protein